MGGFELKIIEIQRLLVSWLSSSILDRNVTAERLGNIFEPPLVVVVVVYLCSHDRLVHSRSEIQMKHPDVAMPALLCHKDTAQGTPMAYNRFFLCMNP